MRRRSIAAPVILILIGALFLLYNLRPSIPMFELVAQYWPFLLIAWGGLRLVEVVFDVFRGQWRGASFSGGEVVLIVFICLLGSGISSAYQHGIHFRLRGLEVFGEQYDFPVSAQQSAGNVRRIVFENLRGNLRVTGGDSTEVKISGRKSVRAMSRTRAEQAHKNTPLEMRAQGDQLFVRTNQERAGSEQRISADLEITVPRGVTVEARSRSGDCDITDITGDVEVSSDRADVRLTRIGGNARVDLRRSDIIRAVEVKGNVDLQGRGGDIELENIAGQVSINGSYSGTLEFKNLAKPLRFESQNTDLRVEALPGRISMDLGEFSARNLVGPIRLITKSRDIRIEQFSNTLELETERGDIELQPARMPLARIDARSRAGKIELILPDKAAFQLQAVAERGDAINDYGPGIQKEVDGRSASLKGKVGQGPLIHLTTERGSVSVRKATVVEAEARL
jgi:DUF4097 and DUF4098 domain-containing protein YvlB